MNRKKRDAVVFACLILALAFVIVDNIALRQENVYLSEQVGLNRPKEIGSTVYIFVKHAGDSRFTLASMGHNTMCNVGLNATRHHISDHSWVNNNATTNGFKWIAIGTGSGGGASSTNLTTLFDSQSATFAEVGSTTGNWTLTYTWTAGSFNNDDISEAGVFNNVASDGDAIILNYQDFTAINLLSGDSLQVQFEFQVS